MRAHNRGISKARLEEIADRLRMELTRESGRATSLAGELETARTRIATLEAENAELTSAATTLLAESKRLEAEVWDLRRKLSRLA